MTDEQSISQTLAALRDGDREASRPFDSVTLWIPELSNPTFAAESWARLEPTQQLVAEHAESLGQAYFMNRASSAFDALRQAARYDMGDGMTRGSKFAKQIRESVEALEVLAGADTPTLDSRADEAFVRAAENPAFAAGWRAQAAALSENIGKLRELIDSPPLTRKSAKEKTAAALPRLVPRDRGNTVAWTGFAYNAQRDAGLGANIVKRALARDRWAEGRAEQVMQLQQQVDDVHLRIGNTPYLQDAQRIANALYGPENTDRFDAATDTAADLQGAVSHANFCEQVIAWREEHQVTDPARAFGREDEAAIDYIAELSACMPMHVRSALGLDGGTTRGASQTQEM